MKTIALVSAALVGAALAPRTPIVQVRDVPNAPTVSIVAWESAQAQFGLRTRLRRDGSHLGEGRSGDHRLYLNTAFVKANGDSSTISVSHTGKVLRRQSGTEKDIDACRFGNVCSPNETVGLNVPDEYLRQNRDSLVVTFRPRGGRNWSVRLDGSLIDAYLTTIDSVSAAMKQQ
jgi:hypothetical protein